jgi:hypothetical protein
VLDPTICRLEDTLTGTFVVRPGRSTGVFRGATGDGFVRIRFVFDFPKRAGKCFYGNGAVPADHGARIGLRLDIPRLVLR